MRAREPGAFNAVEPLWNRLKWGRLAYTAPLDSPDWHDRLRPLFKQTAESILQIKSFWAEAKLEIANMKLRSRRSITNARDHTTLGLSSRLDYTSRRWGTFNSD